MQRIKDADETYGEYKLSELFVRDGFYPGYLSQKIKILFIGRESLGMVGNDYIDVLFDAYHNKIVGDRNLNRYSFHSTMLYIAYALQHSEYDWDYVPYATQFIEEFGRENGCSFAFMNISKFSNESGQWKADNKLIDKFIELSCGFHGREIDLLNPDIIIGMNLQHRMPCLGTFENPLYYGRKNAVCYQVLKTATGKEYIYLDTWHFSAIGKSPDKDIFAPVIEALRANNKLK